MAFSLRRVRLEHALKLIVLLEMINWMISCSLSVIVYIKDIDDESAYGSEVKKGTGTSNELSPKEQKELFEFTTRVIAPTAAALFCIQLFLLYGVAKKNRCLIFSWIILNILIGIPRIIVIVLYTSNIFLKIAVWEWLARCFYFYLAAQYMIQITNERHGEEEVEPPHFRPQTDDPRTFREGLNYPTYPRSLQFSDRITGLNRFEHAHPKRWVPTYDAIDSDGRMVTVVDDPAYESL